MLPLPPCFGSVRRKHPKCPEMAAWAHCPTFPSTNQCHQPHHRAGDKEGHL